METIKTDIAKMLMIIGIWLRGRGLAAAPVLYDEAYNINMAKMPALELIQLSWADFNPTLPYFIIKPFVLWGQPWLARIPSLLASIMFLAILWEMMDDWEVTENQRLMISGLALLPGFYWMAQDVRIYAMIGLLYLMAFWLMTGGQYVWAAITIALMIWSHSIGLILAVSIIVVQLIRDWMLQGMMGIRGVIYKSTARATITSAAIGIIAGISTTLLPLIIGPGGNSENYTNPISLGYFMAAAEDAMFVKVIQPPELVYYFAASVIWFYIFLALLITWQILADWRLILKANVIAEKIEDDVVVTSALLLAVPLALMLAVSLTIKNIIDYRAMTILLLPFILWLGSATAMKVYKPHKLIMPALLAIAVVILNLAWIWHR